MIRTSEDIDELPATHQVVLNECIAEAWRNAENGDPGAQSEVDVAADIAEQLHRIYGVIAHPDPLAETPNIEEEQP